MARQSERTCLASELHHDISQKLLLTRLTLDGIQQLVPAGTEGSKERVEAVSSDIHRLSRNLHPAIVVHLSLVAVLDRLCGEFSEQARIAVEFGGGSVPDRHIEEDLALARKTE